MSPADAIKASRIGLAIDESYEPLVFYCSRDSISTVRTHLCRIGQTARARALRLLGEHEAGTIRIQLVPMSDAEKTKTWEPVAPKTAIDDLADLAR